MEPEPTLDEAPVRQVVVTPAEVVDERHDAPPMLSIFAARRGAVVSPPPAQYWAGLRQPVDKAARH